MGWGSLLERLLGGYDEEALRGLFVRFPNCAPSDGEESWGVLRDPDRGEVPVLVRLVADAERHRTAFKELGELLARGNFPAGVLLLHDREGNYRLGYVELLRRGSENQRPLGRSLLVSKGAPNKVARERLQTLLQKAERSEALTLEDLREVFSVEAVGEAFYREFLDVLEGDLVPGVRGVLEERKRDFALAFVARTLFLAFVAKRGWLGGREDFFPWLLWRYGREGDEGGNFYRDWLRPLFFQALNAPPGSKPTPFAHLPPDVREAYVRMPRLGGELFREKEGLDLPEAFLRDEAVERFYDFLFAYNFTVEENTAHEVDLELNPELLGVVLERLVNTVGVEGKASELGAHYTPRTEVDLICRLALAERLHREGLPLEKAYALLNGEIGGLSREERETARRLLLDVKVLDPAVGSGAFLVGTLQVLEEALDLLGEPRTLERKKRLLKNLHGVDALSWAVWMAELRLWLAYFLELPEEEKNSPLPLLPSLGLKLMWGDSAVQALGERSVPVRLDLDPRLSKEKLRRAMEALLEAKEKHFENRGVAEREVRELEKALVLAALDEVYGKGQASLGLGGVMSDLDAYLAEREALEEALGREDRPFLYSVDFADVVIGRGGFDLVVGNPPYVRQEEIQDPTGRRGAGEYKALLQEEAWKDVKGLLPKRDAEAFPRPPGRADLYVHFYARTLALLNPKGVQAFVASNSWLDVQYGAWLQRVFLEVAPLRYVIENRAKRSFRALVNTAITVAHAPEPGKKLPRDWPIRFVAVRVPFEEADLLEALVEAQRGAGKEGADSAPLRILTKRAGELLEEGRGGAEYLGGKWGGFYLRAPDIYLHVLRKAGDKLVPLSEVAEVRSGIATGANGFFHLRVLPHRPVCPLCGEPHEEALTLEEERAFWLRGERPPEGALVAVRSEGGWEGYLEAGSLAPVVRSPRNLPDFPLEVWPHDLSTRLFHPKKLGLHTKAYISWGEGAEVVVSQGRERGKRVKGYPNLPVLKGRDPWWRLPRAAPPPNLTTMTTYDERFGFWINRGALADARLHAIYPKPGVDLKALAVALNSAFVFLQQGLLGRANLGDGGLDLTVYEAERLLILDPRELGDAEERFSELRAFRIAEEGERRDVMETVLEKEEMEELWHFTRRLHSERICLSDSL